MLIAINKCELCDGYMIAEGMFEGKHIVRCKDCGVVTFVHGVKEFKGRLKKYGYKTNAKTSRKKQK